MEASKEEPMGLCPQYMQEFSCIGGACEANCCDTPWTIYLDRKRYNQLKEALSHSRTDRELAQKAFKRNRSSDKTDSSYAKIVPANGKCIFHDADGLCAIQRRFGEGCLGQVCRTYPRMLRVMGNRLEMTGTFSCPEVVRSCLFAEQAMDVVSFDPSLYNGNRYACSQGAVDPTDPYSSQQDGIRDIALSVLADDQQPFQRRLFSLLYFAHRSREFLYAGATVFNEAQLISEVDRLAEGVYADIWEQHFASQEPPLHLPMTVIQGLLAGCYAKASPEFRDLLTGVWQTYARINDLGQFLHINRSADTVSLECSQLLELYQTRSRLMEEQFQTPLDEALARYLQNLVLKEPYTAYPDLFAWVYDLVLRTALLRFLVISHPGLDAWLQAGEAAAEDQLPSDNGAAPEPLAQTLVDVLFRFSRGLEHNKRFLPGLKESLQAQGMQDLAHAVLLLKL